MVDLDPPTLHRRILGDIQSQILSGAWPPGHRIPFETELAARYRCSRMTVNKAMTELAKAGLIERRRKSGSFVAQPRGQSALLEIRDIKAEVTALGFAYSHRLTRRAERKVRLSDQKAIQLPVGADILEVWCIHAASAHPFCVEHRLINSALVPEALDADFGTEAPGSWLLQRVPWSTAEHRISAVAARLATAAALNLPRGAACLNIERRTWIDRTPVTAVRLTYPGNRHTLIARFAPATA